MNDNITLEWAIHYAKLGYRVIPIRPREKRPPIAAWQDAATTQTGTIQAWWTGRYADHGIGIVTGTLDDGTRYIALDLDEHNPTSSGTATLDRLQERHGRLPETVEAKTGSGGTHLLFRLKESHGDISNGAGRLLGAGIDVRAVNAQIVVAPTVHPNGNEYRWVDGHAPGEIEMATLPDWVADIITTKEQQTATSTVNTRTEDDVDTRAGTRFNRETRWDDLLLNDGWTPHHTENDVYYWTRPNKSVRDGVSATVNHNGNDNLTVFTTSISNLPPGSYDRFGYWTQTRHSGDFKEAARQLNAQNDQQIAQWVSTIQSEQPPQLVTPENRNDDPLTTWYVDWQKLWTDDTTDQEWLIEPILAKGRAHALYAGAKSGKSLLLLELAAALASGRPVLGKPAQPPIDVLYIDFEMTAADVRDRLDAFGYSIDDNLTKLHYVLLPSIAGLDTQEGARAVIAAIKATNSKLVIIDTTARAVEGEENDADTMRAFYRWSGVNMKSLGVTWIRADHAGKDTSKGQRGTSAKNDDVDVVWKFTKRSLTSILIESTHRRMQWVPDKVELELREIDGKLSHHLLGDEFSDAAITAAADLNMCKAPIDITIRAARSLLKEHDIKCGNDILAQAIKLRKQKAANGNVDAWLGTIDESVTKDGTRSEQTVTNDLRNTRGTNLPTASLRGVTRSEHDVTHSSGSVTAVPRSIERNANGTPQFDDLDEIF
jgi:hypothetical protein